MSGCFIMDVAYMRFSTRDRTFFIAVIAAMSDSTLTKGECEDRLHNGRSVHAVLYW